MGRLEELRINAYLSKLHVDIVITHLLPKIYFPLLIQTWKKSISLNLTKSLFKFMILNVQ